MKLSEKLIVLRRRRGWSQEELAAQMGVSRQAVSKWESGQSTPDLEKILMLSELFDVTTDTLLKNDRKLAPVIFDFEEEQDEEGNCLAGTDQTGLDPALQNGSAAGAIKMPAVPKGKMVDLMLAKKYLETKEYTAPRLAMAISICILSVVPMIFLLGLGQNGLLGLNEEKAVGIGVCILLPIVAIGVYKLLQVSQIEKPYEWLEKEDFRLEGQAYAFAEKVRDEWEKKLNKEMSIGIVLCILSPLPLLVTAFTTYNPFFVLSSVSLLLVVVAVGVRFIVAAGMLKGATNVLLQEEEYTPASKKTNKILEPIAGIYWILVTIIYFVWSFQRNSWGISWIVWAIAGMVFAAISIGINAYCKSKAK